MRNFVTTLITRFALLLLLATLIILAATGTLLSPSPVAIAAQLLAVGLAVWARASFPRGAFRVAAAPAAPGVIRRGPYRLIRHPMYSAALLLVWAAVLSHLSVWTLALALVLSGVVAQRIVLEERLLRAHYPEYARYADSTKAVVPYVL